MGGHTKIDTLWRLCFFFLIVLLFSPLLTIWCYAQTEERWMQKVPDHWVIDLPLVEETASREEYPDAGALILSEVDFYSAKEDFAVKVVTLKIFSEKGHPFADISTPVYAKKESLVVWGRTRRKDGSVINLDSRYVHINTVVSELEGVEDLFEKVFTMPGVEDDCIIQYQIVKKEGSFGYQGFPLQGDAPLLASKLIIVLPTKVPVGYRIRPKTELSVNYTASQPSFAKHHTMHTWEVTNVPAFEPEHLTFPKDWLIPKISFETKLFFMIEPSELGKKWQERVGDLCKIKPSQESRKILKSLQLENLEDPEKVAAIYDYLRHSYVRRNGSIYLEDSADDALGRKNKKQNEFDINCLFYQLLLSADINAVPVLATCKIPERIRFTAEQWIASASDITGLLIRIDLNGMEVWADPSSLDYPLGLLPQKYQGCYGVNISKDFINYIGKIIQKVAGRAPGVGSLSKEHTVCIPRAEFLQNRIHTTIESELMEDGSIRGTAKIDYFGALGAEITQKRKDETPLDLKKRMANEIEKYHTGLQLDSLVPSQMEKPMEGFREEFFFESVNYWQKAGGLALVNLNLVHRDTVRLLLPKKDRRYPIFFETEKFEVDSIVFTLPAEYSVEQLPDDYDLKTYFAEFSVRYVRFENKVMFVRKLGIKKTYLESTAYNSVRNFFRTVSDYDNDVIVLKENK